MMYDRKAINNKLTVMMLVKNEAHRYLKMVLDDVCDYADEVVIWDDGSDDETPAICASYKKVVRLGRTAASGFGVDETAPRYSLYQLTLSTQPDWILALDADEVFEDRFKQDVRNMINQTQIDWYGFRFYHFWNSITHYRTDKLWAPVQYGPRLYRHIKGARYVWTKQELHGGSIPLNVYHAFPGANSDIRIKHFGYAGSLEEIRRKYEFYTGRDPVSQYCPRSHYDSMLDPNPVLELWVEHLED